MLHEELEQIKNPSSDNRNSLSQWIHAVEGLDSGRGVLNSDHNVSMIIVFHHDKTLQFNILWITMDVEDSNQILDNVSNNLYHHIQKQGGQVDYVRLRYIVKQGVILVHVFQTIQRLLEEDMLYQCIQNLHRMDTRVHSREDFLRELENELDSMDSESIYIQYAIAIKKYKKIGHEHAYELQSVLHTISQCTLDDMLDVIQMANQKIKAYRELKENVCASLFRMFEYIVEYEQLIMLQSSLPSSDPLLEQEAAPRFLLE